MLISDRTVTYSVNRFFYSISDIKARKIPGTHSNGCRMSAHRFLKFWFNIDKTQSGPGNWVDTTNSIKRV